MVRSAYIHIPFCKSKCKYCSFVSYPDCFDDYKEQYIKTLLKEIDFYYKRETLDTLYIGGGTPTLLDANDLKKLLDCLNFDASAEVTVEANPETVDYKYLNDLLCIGVNRLSIGVQSFDDNILKTIGRIHSSQKAVDTVEIAKSVGFSNISLDFIYGLPLQTLDSFVSDLNKAAMLNVNHISLYGLKIEEGCAFYLDYPKNIADEDLQADMYLAAIKTLENLDYKHYEISNFCKNGKISRHNMNYWAAKEYYGFGAAAHGYVDGIRYSNFSSLSEYFEKYKQKEQSHFLTNKEMLDETIFLGLRRQQGIDVNEINKNFNINFENMYNKVLNKYLETGHLIETSRGFAFSDEGFLLSNVILADFI